MIDIRKAGCQFARTNNGHENCTINEIELERLNNDGWKHHYAVKPLHMVHDGIKGLMR